MMEWADIARLYRYWAEAPPVHELVAAAVGFRRPRGAEADRAERPALELSADEIVRGFNAAAAVPMGVR